MAVDPRRLARLALAIVSAAGAAAALAAVALGALSAWWGLAYAAMGVFVAIALRKGGRAAATLFAIWCAIGLIAGLRGSLADEAALAERVRAAAAGGLAFAASALVALWACGGERGDGD